MTTSKRFVEGELSEQTGESSSRCAHCGAIDRFQDVSWPSYGGTTEGYLECVACGSYEPYADLSAVI